MIEPRKLFIALVGADAVLAAALVYALAVPVSEPDVPAVAPKPNYVQSAALLPVVTPPAEDFTEIARRPLFSATRVGIPASAETEGALPPDIQLVGIIADTQDKLALVRMAGEPLAKALHLGAMVSGWRVADILADRVVLEGAQGRVEFRLDANKPPKQPVAPVVPNSQ